MNDREGSRIGGWLVVFGSLGVIAITGIYASAPPIASVPLPASVPMAEALAATLDASVTLTWAGSIGLVADIFLIAGSCLLALRASEPAFQRLFWIGLALSAGIFIVVDALAGQVIPAIANSTIGDLTAFALARKIFDIAFALGVFTFGAGSLTAFAATGWPRPFRYAALVLGIVATLSFVLHVAGLTLPLLFGASVGLAGILGLVIGFREVRAA